MKYNSLCVQLLVWLMPFIQSDLQLRQEEGLAKGPNGSLTMLAYQLMTF